jgi:cytochrome c
MQLCKLGLVGLLVALSLASEVGHIASAQSTSTDRGRTIAEKKCARCHAIGRDGSSPMGLAPPFRTLSQRYPIETLAEALAEGIVTGHPEMPQFVFQPRDIDALLGYIAGLAPL